MAFWLRHLLAQIEMTLRAQKRRSRFSPATPWTPACPTTPRRGEGSRSPSLRAGSQFLSHREFSYLGARHRAHTKDYGSLLAWPQERRTSRVTAQPHQGHAITYRFRRFLGAPVERSALRHECNGDAGR